MPIFLLVLYFLKPLLPRILQLYILCLLALLVHQVISVTLLVKRVEWATIIGPVYNWVTGNYVDRCHLKQTHWACAHLSQVSRRTLLKVLNHHVLPTSIQSLGLRLDATEWSEAIIEILFGPDIINPSRLPTEVDYVCRARTLWKLLDDWTLGSASRLQAVSACNRVSFIELTVSLPVRILKCTCLGLLQCSLFNTWWHHCLNKTLILLPGRGASFVHHSLRIRCFWQQVPRFLPAKYDAAIIEVDRGMLRLCL